MTEAAKIFIDFSTDAAAIRPIGRVRAPPLHRMNFLAHRSTPRARRLLAEVLRRKRAFCLNSTSLEDRIAPAGETTKEPRCQRTDLRGGQSVAHPLEGGDINYNGSTSPTVTITVVSAGSSTADPLWSVSSAMAPFADTDEALAFARYSVLLHHQPA